MVGNVLSTEHVAANDAFAYWQDLVCDVFINLQRATARSNGFSGFIYNQQFGDLQLSSMRSTEMELRRTTRHIARESEDYFIIPVHGAGRSLASQDGRDTILQFGDFSIVDSTRPYWARLEAGFEHYVLKVPKAALTRKIGPLDRTTCVRIPGDRGLGKLTSAFIRMLPLELDGLDTVAARRLSETCLDLLAAAVGNVLNAEVSPTSARLSHLIHARNYIEAHLTDPRLSADRVAQSLKLSLRYLNSIFAAEEISVGRYILKRRLDKCRAALVTMLNADGRSARLRFPGDLTIYPISRACFERHSDRRRANIAKTCSAVDEALQSGA